MRNAKHGYYCALVVLECNPITDRREFGVLLHNAGMNLVGNEHLA